MAKLILVVEDEEPIRELIMDILEDKGYRVLGAANGKEALEHLDDVQIDLITLDLMMPVMDGNEFLTKLTELGSNTPVIVISATRNKLIAHPLVSAEISKPFNIDVLVAMVKEYLK